MSDELYSRSRLKHLIFSIVLSPAVVYVLPDLGWGVKVLMVGIGLLIGYVTGHRHWEQVRRRIDKRNTVILYYTDTLTYSILAVLALLSFRPFMGARGIYRVFSTYPWLFPAGLCYWLGLWIGQNWSLYRGVRTFEHERGPVIAKHFYSPNVVGKEGMIGRRGKVAKTCNPIGKAKIRGEWWNAESIDGREIVKGQEVVVRDIEGLTLIVEEATQE